MYMHSQMTLQCIVHKGVNAFIVGTLVHSTLTVEYRTTRQMVYYADCCLECPYVYSTLVKRLLTVGMYIHLVLCSQ